MYAADHVTATSKLPCNSQSHAACWAVHVPASFGSLLQSNCFIQSYVSVSLWMHIPASVVSFLKTNCFIQSYNYVSISLWMQHNCFIQLCMSISLWMQYNCFIQLCMSISLWMQHNCFIKLYRSISLWMQYSCFIQLCMSTSLWMQYKFLWALGPFYSIVCVHVSLHVVRAPVVHVSLLKTNCFIQPCTSDSLNAS